MRCRSLLIALFLACLVSASCKKHSSNVACTNAPIDVYGIGFGIPDSLADLLTYKADNAFDSLKDSVRFTHFSFDTVYWPALQSITLLPGNDYRLVLRGSGSTFRVSNVKHGHHYNEQMASGTGNSCYNPVISYSLNDSTIKAGDTTKTHAAARLYLYK